VIAFAHLLALRLEVSWLAERASREAAAGEEALPWGT